MESALEYAKMAVDLRGFVRNLTAQDAQRFMHWALVGGLTFAAYKASYLSAARTLHPSAELVDRPHYLAVDPQLCAALERLQQYRDIDPVHFKCAVLAADRLVKLEKDLLDGEPPSPDDAQLAASHMRTVARNLYAFQESVEIGTDGGVTAEVTQRLAVKIAEMLEPRVHNVFVVCRTADASCMAPEPTAEVRRALERMGRGQPAPAS